MRWRSPDGGSAGEPMSFIDEVQSYFQVRISEVDTDVYAAAHENISQVLGGFGPLDQRLAAFRAAETCPPELVETVVRTVAAALRDRVTEPTGLAGLPEHIDFEIARNVSWSGFNYYLGGFRSRVAVNADIGHRMSQFGVLVAHECYPGHHTEHCRKEDLLVDRGGQAEHTIFLVNTPQCLMAEGLGDLALTAAVGTGWGRWLAEVLDGIGPAVRPGRGGGAGSGIATVEHGPAERRDHAARPRAPMPRTCVAYQRRWSLASEEQARQRMRFMTDPLWRAYTSTYVEGDRLLRPWLAARTPGTSALHRFQRLLDEPLTPMVIQDELAGAR